MPIVPIQEGRIRQQFCYKKQFLPPNPVPQHMELGIMSRQSRHFLKAGLIALAATTIALPPALASLSRTDRIRDTQLSETLLGQFTPASGDPRLIARYNNMAANTRSQFSFTPAITDNDRKNRAITVVIRANEANPAARMPAARGKAAIAIQPLAYDLGASVGFDKFVTPAIPRGTDLKHLPQARALEGERHKPSRFAAQMRPAKSDPEAAPDRWSSIANDQAVDVVSSYRLTKNLDVTAGYRYKSEDAVEPLTDGRRDSQAVYIGTAFRF